MASKRQLAAIMFTDIVGYTTLMGEDERKAFEFLRKNRQLQKPMIERYNGQWIKELGDGVLASFSTASDAVLCAIEIQRVCNKNGEYKLRIGIHLGEVVFEDGDVFGDGVNIASRLQALAPVGRTWISEMVYKNVSNKKEIKTRFAQEEVLKNVKEPIRIYEVGTEEADPSFVTLFPAKKVLPVRKPVSVIHRNPKPLFLAAIIILLLTAIGLGYWFYAIQNTRQIKSIAVMPFVNESKNMDVEYLSDGMTETLIGYLSQLPDLDVKARSSVFRYKGKETNAQTIGKELNVQAILTGRLIQRGQDLTLYTELVDAKKETVLWSEDYKQPMASLLSLQSEITRDVVQKLKTRLSGAEQQKLAKNYTANSEAYQLYLKGRYYWNKRTAKDVDKSIEYYQQAIAVDPNYALAYAGLADSYTTSYTSSLGRIPSLERMKKGREAAVKALALDDNLAEAHTAFGRVLTVFDYDFKVAEREFRRAIALNPAYAVTYERYAFVLAYQSRWEEALFHVRRAVDIEPLNLSFSNTYGLLLMLARRYDEAIAQLKKTLELDPNFQLTHNVLSIAYWLKGDYAQSVEERAKTLELNGDVQKAAQVRESYAKGGWSEFLRLVVRESITFSTPFYNLATYYAALGEKDNAFAALNKALENRETLIATIKIDPRLDPLRNDPRFQQLVQRVGFK